MKRERHEKKGLGDWKSPPYRQFDNEAYLLNLLIYISLEELGNVFPIYADVDYSYTCISHSRLASISTTRQKAVLLYHGYWPSFDRKQACSSSLSPLRILIMGAAPSLVGLAPLSALLWGPKFEIVNPGV